jgi:hypothetical protein
MSAQEELTGYEEDAMIKGMVEVAIDDWFKKFYGDAPAPEKPVPVLERPRPKGVTGAALAQMDRMRAIK